MSIIAPEMFGPLSDATLLSVAWEHEGRDLAIELALAQGDKRRFVFTWVDGFYMSIQQREKGPSQPLSWDGGAERLQMAALGFASTLRVRARSDLLATRSEPTKGS